MRYSDRMIAEAEARGDIAAVTYWRGIAAVVDQAPPLSSAQKDRLRILLRPGAFVAEAPRTTTAAPVATGTAA
jgi:hypothetical protein